jgi:hypothetical protein
MRRARRTSSYGGAIYSADESDWVASGRLQRGLVYRRALFSHRGEECGRGCPLPLLPYGVRAVLEARHYDIDSIAAGERTAFDKSLEGCLLIPAGQ